MRKNLQRPRSLDAVIARMYREAFLDDLHSHMRATEYLLDCNDLDESLEEALAREAREKEES